MIEPDGALDHAFDREGSLASLAALADDRRRGAAEIAEATLDWFVGWDEVDDPADPAPVAEALAKVGRAQAAMAPVLRVANDLLLEIERRAEGPADATRRALARAADEWRRRLATASEALVLHLRRALEGAATVYTYSASSTVERAILAHAAGGAWFRVVVSESRPGNEGAALAHRLADRGIPVRLGTDVWLWGAFDEPGVLTVGADALTSTGWVNKIGTAALARRAREGGVDVVVGAGTSKWLPPALASLPRSWERDPAEIAIDPPAALEAVNPYFEEMSWDALDRLVTERGPTRPRDLRGGEIPVARALR